MPTNYIIRFRFDNLFQKLRNKGDPFSSLVVALQFGDPIFNSLINLCLFASRELTTVHRGHVLFSVFGRNMKSQTVFDNRRPDRET